MGHGTYVYVYVYVSVFNNNTVSPQLHDSLPPAPRHGHYLTKHIHSTSSFTTWTARGTCPESWLPSSARNDNMPDLILRNK
jgi:hypothetical protein